MRNEALAALALVGLAVSLRGQTPYSGHGAGSIPPEVVKKYAPPPLDPEVAGRIQGMLDVRAPGLGLVSPDGRRLYFGWSITGTPAVWRLDGPKSFPVQMTGGDDRTTVVDVTPDGRFLVLSRDHGGQEAGIYLSPRTAGPPVISVREPRLLQLRRRLEVDLLHRERRQAGQLRGVPLRRVRARSAVLAGRRGNRRLREEPGTRGSCCRRRRRLSSEFFEWERRTRP